MVTVDGLQEPQTTHQVAADCLEDPSATFCQIIGQMYLLHCRVIVAELGPSPTETMLVEGFAQTCQRRPTLLQQYASGETIPTAEEVQFLGSRWGLSRSEIRQMVERVEKQRYNIREFGSQVASPGFTPTAGLPRFLDRTDKEIIDYSWKDMPDSSSSMQFGYSAWGGSNIRWNGLRLLRDFLRPLAEKSPEKLENIRIQSQLSRREMQSLLYGGNRKGATTEQGCKAAAALLSDSSPLDDAQKLKLLNGLPISWRTLIEAN